ncbi:MAG: hypothetical protein JEY79_02930 [Pseudodesulfovibrio sp.]|nr:hypothetical protein [Pseudodesulfovibrio sp.]
MQTIQGGSSARCEKGSKPKCTSGTQGNDFLEARKRRTVSGSPEVSFAVRLELQSSPFHQFAKEHVCI